MKTKNDLLVERLEARLEMITPEPVPGDPGCPTLDCAPVPQPPGCKCGICSC